MDRRVFLTGLGAVLAAPRAAGAQPKAKVPKIGVLSSVTAGDTLPMAEAFREGLRSFGYIEGQNIAIEWRYADGRAERVPELAVQLVRLGVDLILSGNTPVTTVVQRATRTIPIVMVLAVDPVGAGFVTSLSHPGGNITGLSSQIPDLAGKRLQLLKEVLPQVSRVAVLWDPDVASGRRLLVTETEAAARALGLSVQVLETPRASDIDTAFAAMVRDRPTAALVLGSAMQFGERAHISELATKNRLPTICALRQFVEAGCLMAFGPNFAEQWRRAAYFIDKILKGTKPGDLPVEQPTKFELILNLKTARALGLTIPPSLLLRADQVIE
jgi:putative ABC transport system substrate-binding protein